jgi:hypothetical protein
LRHPTLARWLAALALCTLGCASSQDETSQSLNSGSAEPDGASAPPAQPPDAGALAAGDAASECMGGLPHACCEPPTVAFDLALLPACPNCGGGAHCLPRTLVEQRVAELSDRLGACDESSLCVPDPFLRSLGFHAPPSCRSLNDAEGRCLSECLPEVASQRDILPQADCAAHERCVPCFDPLHGGETGACGLTCDVGPSEPPRTLARCCGDAGRCVPEALVPEAERARLGKDTCEAEAALCAPALLMDESARPTVCSSLAGSEGRCLPSCLPEVASRASELPQDLCAAGEACVPCTDPLTGEDSGACGLHGDAPREPPQLFASCCGELGACIPAELVGERNPGPLEREECESPGDLCVPRSFLDAGFVPPSCRSFADAEGRCLAACLLPELDRSVPLPQASCAQGELCAPCYNPADGTATGACSLRGDGPREPPVRFDTACCGTSGVCIPGALAGSGANVLPADRCDDEHGDGWLCAPKSVVDDPNRASDPFQSCKMKIGFFSAGRGKCVPQCMIDAKGWVQKLLSRSSCASGERCVPCSLGDVPGC